MARTLIGEGVPNIVQPSTEYPFGKFKDKTSASSNDGTELSERVLGDMYQGMLNTITGTGITPNNLPERKGDSQFQKAVELLKPVATCVVGANNDSFEILSSVIRDPEITLGASAKTNPEDLPYLSANFRILRNGVIDDSHRYLVTATPVCDLKKVWDAQIPLAAMIATPKVIVGLGNGTSSSPYFNNISIYIYNISNLFFLYPQAVSPSDALAFAKAVITVYDAGPVS